MAGADRALTMTHAEVRTRVQALAGLGSWKLRRRMMFCTVAFCMAVIVYCLVADRDSRVAETAVSSAFYLLAVIILGYVFGAAWEDIKTKQAVLNAPPAVFPKE